MDDDATDLGGAGFGLMFYNARWYDPVLGRFAQADTIVPGGVQGLDRYAYANNSPMNYVDPSGHMAWEGDSGGCNEFNRCLKEKQDLVILESRKNELKCNTGSDAYCSTAIHHPAEVIAFTAAGLVAGPVVEEFITGGGAASAIDAAGAALQSGYDKLVYTCLLSDACRQFTGMAGGAGAGGETIPDNAFVKYDPVNSDKSIDENGLLTSYSGGQTWLTQYKYVKDITNPADLETILYRKNLWADPDVVGRFSNGATLRTVNVTDAIPAGVTNMTNGIPQWYITYNVPPDLLQIIWRLSP